MTKYQPLILHLSASRKNVVRLTFQKIEAILGNTLPKSARLRHAWWANSRTHDSHTWAHMWLKAGWRRSRVNFTDEWVEFRRLEHYDLEDAKAREGYLVDRRILSGGRNRALALKRKQHDDHSCQACGFRMEVNGRFVIEVHHLNPLADGEVMTRMGDLVCLCPTCHRIAHLRSEPYRPDEIRVLRKQLSGA